MILVNKLDKSMAPDYFCVASNQSKINWKDEGDKMKKPGYRKNARLFTSRFKRAIERIFI